MRYYDEQAVLWDYIWGWYSHLMTEHERLVLHTAGVVEKTESVSPRMSAFLRERFGETGEDNPEVLQDLKDGVEAFKRRIFDRLMSECMDSILINRCAKCNGVVRAPEAQQCLWCSHDWHTDKTGGH